MGLDKCDTTMPFAFPYCITDMGYSLHPLLVPME
ncbi:uncharacterized protein G2W53_031231 [Senna tora]|uniref:Uncharacterized protein n=1 Tax=Senna tora TaxID=362788 RepID=A0A834TAE6_9FABA|nr:uncharacterized protein G2W53_031231 [Senna tora]